MSHNRKYEIKYYGLCVEIYRMWNRKCVITTVITGTTGVVIRVLKKNLEAISVNIQWIHYNRQLYWKFHTLCGKYCSLKVKA
jgi:hypothetical protein